jgi:surface protein
MASIFEGCSSLESIDLSMFDTSKVENMNSMFKDCSSLKSLDLSKFDTSLVTKMDEIFYNCYSLSILDISNFNMIQTESANNIFYNITKLDYINLYNVQDNGYISISDINQESKIENLLYVCQKTNIITNPISLLCCDYFNNKEECILNIDITKVSRLIKLKYNYFSDNIANQNHQIFQLAYSTFQISTLKEQLNNPKEVSSVDLGECERIIKGKEGLSETDQLIILKLDIRDPISNAINIQYEIFNPKNYKKISLDICRNIPIKIITPVITNDALIDLIDNLKDEGYVIFDLKDKFYNDICATYTAKNGQDITLSGRKNRIYDSVKDLNLCQNGCEFKSFDTNTSKSTCKCKVQESNTVADLSKINFDKSELYDGFYSTLYNSNFRTLKCFKLLFSLEGIKSNYGFYFMSSTFLAFIAFFYFI